MSYCSSYNSSILNEDSVRQYRGKLTEYSLTKGNTGVEVFNQTIVNEDGTRVERTGVNAYKEDRSFDISKLLKKYEKNPEEIFNELDIRFTNEQKNNLKKLLTNKKRLEAFLKIAQNDKLSADDIYTAIQNVKEFKPSKWYNRISKSLSVLTQEGFTDFIKYTKSETVYYAEKLGNNMNAISQERNDFSSQGKTDVAEAITRKPKQKNNIMHFVSQRCKDYTKYYTENDVLRATRYIYNNTKKANEFTSNAMEIESITDSNGVSKYTGNTTLNVSERITNNPEIKDAAIAVGKKGDMTDTYFNSITANLYKNPAIKDAIYESTTAKDKYGNDKYKAVNVNDISNTLADKSNEYVQNYSQIMKELDNYSDLKGKEIIEIAKQGADNPESNEEILNKYTNQNVSETNTHEKYAQETIQQNINDNNVKYESAPKLEIKNQQKSQSYTAQRNTTDTDFYKEEETSFRSAVIINGKSYERTEIIEVLYKNFGPMAGKLLQNLEKDNDFAAIIKSCSGNKELLRAIVENPQVLKKLNSALKMSRNELTDAYKLCTNELSLIHI